MAGGTPFSVLPAGSGAAERLEATQVESLVRLRALREELDVLLPRSAAAYAGCEQLAARGRHTVRKITAELGQLERRVAECRRRAMALTGRAEEA